MILGATSLAVLLTTIFASCGSMKTTTEQDAIEVKDISTYPILDVGKRLLKHPAFGPAGTNVTFFQRMVGQRIKATTFERGVEYETFACGTGVAAAAIVYSELFLQPFPIEVEVPGGVLNVDVSPVSKMLLLQGPAQHVYTVELDGLPRHFDKPFLFNKRYAPKSASSSSFSDLGPLWFNNK